MIKMYNKRKNGISMEEQQLKELFDEWKIRILKEDSKAIFNYDGFIDFNLYKQSDIKILFVLKESYSKEILSNKDDFSITRLLYETIQEAKIDFGSETQSSQMFNMLGFWAYGLLHKENDFQKTIEVLKNLKQKYLPSCAYMNASKKVLIGQSFSDSKKVKAEFEKFQEFNKKEIEIINPNIIICGGVEGDYGLADEISKIFDPYNETKWLDGGANGIKKIKINNKNVWLVSANHPAVVKDMQSKYQQVMDLLKYLN